MYPKPRQKPHPPIIFGGESLAALRRVADVGQGWYGFNLSPEEVLAPLARLDELLAERDRHRRELHTYVSPYMQACGLDEIRRYRDAGVDQVILPVSAGGLEKFVRDLDRISEQLLIPLDA